MLRFIGKRLLALIPMLILLTIVVFALVEVTPGDPARIIAGPDATEEAVEDIRHELDLDQPLHERYVSYVGDLVRFDLGTSLTSDEPVSELIARRLPRTATLSAFALLVSVVLSVPLGVLAALRRNRLADRLVTGASVALMAIPGFVLAAVLVAFFSLGGPRWFPPTGYAELGDGLGEWLRHATLPAIAIATIPLAELTRQARGSLVDVLEEDYIRTARAKGLSQRLVIGKHAMKNAAVPYLTILGLNAGRIVGTIVIVEQIFNIRGFGLLGVEAVLSRDIPTLQGTVLVGGLIVMVMNLAVDVSHGYLNPNARTS